MGEEIDTTVFRVKSTEGWTVPLQKGGTLREEVTEDGKYKLCAAFQTHVCDYGMYWVELNDTSEFVQCFRLVHGSTGQDDAAFAELSVERQRLVDMTSKYIQKDAAATGVTIYTVAKEAGVLKVGKIIRKLYIGDNLLPFPLFELSIDGVELTKDQQNSFNIGVLSDKVIPLADVTMYQMLKRLTEDAAKNAVTRAKDAEECAKNAEKRAEDAEKRAENAETRAEDAEIKLEKATSNVTSIQQEEVTPTEIAGTPVVSTLIVGGALVGIVLLAVIFSLLCKPTKPTGDTRRIMMLGDT